MTFRMTPIPNLMTPDEINTLVEKFSRATRVIDLQRRYRIEVEREPTLDRLRRYTARDLLSFDADPSSRWHVIGRGDSPQDAVLDLLDTLAELYEAIDSPRPGRVIHSSPFEPADVVDEPYCDTDEDIGGDQ